MTNTIPRHEIRFGRVKAAIWANDTTKGTRFNVTICRLYKDGTEWKMSDSFGRDDLPLVSKVADLAHTWVYEQSSTTDWRQERDEPESSDGGTEG